MTVVIELNQAKRALVDDDDYNTVIGAGPWFARFDDGNWYVQSNQRSTTNKCGWTVVMLHRFILGIADPKIKVDHVNGNGLDNCRNNLRVATDKQNAGNQKISKNNTSGYKGVTREGRKWHARIGVDGQRIHLGYFDTPEMAAVAYNAAAIAHFGEFAKLNEVIV